MVHKIILPKILLRQREKAVGMLNLAWQCLTAVYLN